MMKCLDNGRYLSFYCPGCHTAHVVPVKDHPNAWDFNGNFIRPTLSPSILVNQNQTNQSMPVCHFYLRDGYFEFLSDCTHELAGRVVEMMNGK